MSLKPHQREFISLAIKHNVLCFGSFELKSGRISPYFFNAGLFNTGAALSALGQYYAATIEDANSAENNFIEYDAVFGPAYKGIPLASATAIALSLKHNKDVPFSFNRKEKKDHGEGGDIVGAPLKGRILIIDDVITAGTAIRESLGIIRKHKAIPAGIIVAVDRQERGTGGKSAIQEIEENYDISVKAIVTLEHIITFMEEQGGYEVHLKKMEEYQMAYGIKYLNKNKE